MRILHSRYGHLSQGAAGCEPGPDPGGSLQDKLAFAIRNNICRCTGYKKIIDAILLAAELFPQWRRIPQEKDLCTGMASEAMPRIDAEKKVLGTGKYPDDIYLDGMITWQRRAQ